MNKGTAVGLVVLGFSVALAIFLFVNLAKVNTDLEKELGSHAVEGGTSKAFTFKITVWALGADSDMGNMKVKVTVKGTTQSKTVNMGKQALYWDDSDFVVAKFDFKNIKNGDHYIACIANRCHDSETIRSKSVTEQIWVGRN